MNNLETELGCHLFVRSNRGVSLTPEGQKLFNHVAIAFEQLELGEAELKRDQSLTSGLISIGVSEETAKKDACRMEHVISDESFDKIKMLPR